VHIVLWAPFVTTVCIAFSGQNIVYRSLDGILRFSIRCCDFDFLQKQDGRPVMPLKKGAKIWCPAPFEVVVLLAARRL
jgi:hypothetical protein